MALHHKKSQTINNNNKKYKMIKEIFLLYAGADPGFPMGGGVDPFWGGMDL